MVRGSSGGVDFVVWCGFGVHHVVHGIELPWADAQAAVSMRRPVVHGRAVCVALATV